ncbi:MAG TPA: pyridoxamine 5'-phosphate oxidase [Phycisphaerae bacterium]|nr:pyridoxamine 5'-phosphate oxidase [Phycisphaerae bacterium]
MAAGKSTRMVTEMPKVLHEICGRPMLAYVIDACRAAGIKRIVCVVGYRKDEVINAFGREPDITFVEQKEQKGTGHAVMVCREALASFDGDLVIIAGDMPLLRHETLELLTKTHQAQNSAVTLATANKDGQPSARIVLLKGLDARGFIFFTNYLSRKARELDENPRAAMVFYWAGQERQVCVRGTVSKVPREESEAYFRSRPRGSRLAAWASHQSDVIENRAVLEERWAQLEKQYAGKDIPTPDFWGGYVLDPDYIEFWQGRPSRLHDRFRYIRQPDRTWRIERLSP